MNEDTSDNESTSPDIELPEEFDGWPEDALHARIKALETKRWLK